MKPNILILILQYLDKMRTLTFGSTYENIYERQIIKTIPYNLNKIVIDNTWKKKISKRYFNIIDPYIYIGRLFYEYDVYSFNDYFNIFEKLKKNIIGSIIKFNVNFNNSTYLEKLILITLSHFVDFFEECLSFDFLVYGDKNYDESTYRKFGVVKAYIFTNFYEEFKPENLEIKKDIFFSEAQKLWNKRYQEFKKIKSLSAQNEVNIALNKKNYFIDSAKYYGHYITFGYFKPKKEEKNKMKEDLKLVKFKEKNKKKQNLELVKYQKNINYNPYICLKNLGVLITNITNFVEQLKILFILLNNNIKKNSKINDDENASEERIFRDVPGTADSNLNEIDE